MSKIINQIDLGQITDQTQFIRLCSQAIANIQNTVNGLLDFGNFNAQIVTQAFVAGSKDTVISHGLNRTGLYFMPIRKSVASDLYLGSSPATNTSITLRCSVRVQCRYSYSEVHIWDGQIHLVTR